MARVAEAGAIVPLEPARALALWTDLDRWPMFVEGFARLSQRSEEWPREGAEIVWESIPEGRGRVTERVQAYAEPGAEGSGLLVTAIEDDSLAGEQTAAFHPVEEGTRVELDLAYELTDAGFLAPVTDFIFIRRALRDALRRTLVHFAAEAAEGPPPGS
ncbi:MAG: SRPBCC family protein [Thermoleophilaceae bacterium]